MNKLRSLSEVWTSFLHLIDEETPGIWIYGNLKKRELKEDMRRAISPYKIYIFICTLAHIHINTKILAVSVWITTVLARCSLAMPVHIRFWLLFDFVGTNPPKPVARGSCLISMHARFMLFFSYMYHTVGSEILGYRRVPISFRFNSGSFFSVQKNH